MKWGPKLIGGYINFIPNYTWTYNTKIEVIVDTANDTRYEYEYFTANCSEHMPDYVFDRMMGRKSERMTWYLIVSYCILSITFVVIIIYVVVVFIKIKNIQFGKTKQPETRTESNISIIDKEKDIPSVPKRVNYSPPENSSKPSE